MEYTLFSYSMAYVSLIPWYMADSHESRTIGVPLQNSDLVFHGFYLDKCIDLIESFQAIRSFPYVELETRATEADKGPFNENGVFYF